MAKNYNDISLRESLNKFFKIIRLEKKEVTAIYFYAILSGVIQLTLPLGIQTIINFAQAAAGIGQLPVSIVLLILIVLNWHSGIGHLTGKPNEDCRENRTKYIHQILIRLCP